MGVPGLWDEINKVSPGRDVPVARLAAGFFEEHKRPMRIAVDTPLAIFEFEAATRAAEHDGGMNHTTRTFFYHIMHLMEAGVQPVFVFDGPQKPAEKGVNHPQALRPCKHVLGTHSTDQRTSEDVVCERRVSHINGLCRQVMKHLGIPYRDAPGEGEAECAAMEKAGIVNAVMTKDGDAFIFGAQRVLQKGTAVKQVAHVRQYLMADMRTTQQRPGFRWHDFFLLAIMRGGDYDKGIPGCGPAIAVQAARAGFAGKLVAQLQHGTQQSLARFRDELGAALAGKFTPRYPAVAKAIPKDFPNRTIANHYLRPVVSPDLARLSVDWDRECSLDDLREWTRVYFNWRHAQLAGKFVRVLSVPLLVKQLVSHITQKTDGSHLIRRITAAKEDEKGRMLRVEFRACQVVAIDISHERIVDGWQANLKAEPYDPQTIEREWLPRWVVEHGAPSAFQQWEATQGQKAKKRKTTAAKSSTPQETALKRQRYQPPKVSGAGASSDFIDLTSD